MSLGILARKIGMTQLFIDTRAVGATVLEAQPCRVVQIKTEVRDGYNALQLGYEEVAERKVTRPLRGHYQKAGLPPTGTCSRCGSTTRARTRSGIGSAWRSSPRGRRSTFREPLEGWGSRES